MILSLDCKKFICFIFHNVQLIIDSCLSGVLSHFFMSQMSHESSYESLSGFSPKVKTRIRVGIDLMALGLMVFIFLKFNILTHGLI